MAYALQIGVHLIQDILNPQPEEIDLAGIEANLWNTSRFSNSPNALKVRQHTWLVAELAEWREEPTEVVRWCKHHDDHEGVMGDWPGPMKHLIRQHTDVIERIENRLDWAICMKRGIPLPDAATRQTVHFYDKLAETLEWHFVMGRPIVPWNMPYRNWLNDETAYAFCVQAMNLRAA